MSAAGLNPPHCGVIGQKARSPAASDVWLHAKARLTAGTLTHSPPYVREVFGHAWAPMQALARQIRWLSDPLLDYLLACDGGFVMIGHKESRYTPGPTVWRQRTLNNVAFVSVEDLARDNVLPLHVIGHLIDHYLGSGGEADGAWLSDGDGVNAAWREAGTRLRRLFALGYSVDEVARSGYRDYFARSFAWYCRDPQALNVADPQVHKWLRSTLWNAAFWAGATTAGQGKGVNRQDE